LYILRAENFSFFNRDRFFTIEKEMAKNPENFYSKKEIGKSIFYVFTNFFPSSV
jgi:hypothetical protein